MSATKSSISKFGLTGHNYRLCNIVFSEHAVRLRTQKYPVKRQTIMMKTSYMLITTIRYK